MVTNQYTRLGMALALAALLAALPVRAFDYPLSSEAIREAYFLGKADPQKRVEFLAPYTQTPPMPETGPHVASISFETPFVVIVERMAKAPNATTGDAEQEFLGKPGMLRMRVEIDLTTSYSWILSASSSGTRLRSGDFWKDFTIRLTQDGKEIAARSVHGVPLYTFASSDTSSQLRGAAVTLTYNAARISSEPADVHVLTPDGQDVTATFDLGRLR